MKALIIYFSLTGYTRQAAEEIRKGIGEAGGSADLVPIREADPSRFKDYDLIGIGCPVYHYHEPFNVEDFLEGLPDLSGQHWFVFCTHGSIMGVTLVSMAGRLRKKGALVIDSYDMYADATLAFIPHPTTTTGHPDALDLETARRFGRNLPGHFRRVRAGETHLIPPLKPVDEEWVRSAEMFSRELLKNVMPRLELNRERCTLCLQCQNDCPVQGIDVEADPPRLQEPCTYCYNCVYVCPVMALDADWEMVESMNEGHYARLIEALHQAAAAGEFRWLIDPAKINYEDTYHKQWKRERLKK